MTDAIAVLNAGSSSLKFSLFAQPGDDLQLVVRGQAEGLQTAPSFVAKSASGQTLASHDWGQGTPLGHDCALAHIVAFLQDQAQGLRLLGVGHRVVHGGLKYAQPVRMDRAVVQELEQFIPLAPLHQPHNLTPIRLMLERQPGLPQVACFDTAFHRAQPELAQMFGDDAGGTCSRIAQFRVLVEIATPALHFGQQRRVNRS